ncbi:hypothetical protein KAR91_34520 [Candidatus Pacearchaeota archaeon]|nr:hypothetical protein [Candidatus Pacearchaeota archaeon]
MLKPNEVDNVEDVLRHYFIQGEIYLREMIIELRKCPYAGQVGASCKKVEDKDVSDKESSGTGAEPSSHGSSGCGAGPI